ncbi:MAG: amidohydrolase family protein [Bacteroidales bacterium]
MKFRCFTWVVLTGLLAVLVLPVIFCQFRQGKQPVFYTMEDFQLVKKIDAHVHINEGPSWLMQARKDNMRMITLNTSIKQRDRAVRQRKAFPDRLAWATAFSLEGWDDPGWQEKTIVCLEESFAMGAIAVKVWKNIGMSLRDSDGNFVMIDDPQFDPVFDYLARNKIPLVGHIGDPKNCWLPLEEMTVKTDRKYFEAHPRYHMYLHPEYPSHAEIMDARDRMLARHPDLHFIGAHLGSLEWDVDELARRFDRYPNFAVDMAERVCHLQLQSQENRNKVREFIIRYQDRLIYGSDFGSGLSRAGDPDSVLTGRMHHLWTEAWRYFATDELMKAPEFDGTFRGLKLPAGVVDKIFRINAEKWFTGIPATFQQGASWESSDWDCSSREQQAAGP